MLLFLLQLFAFSHALQWDGPAETLGQELPLAATARVPQPTEAPKVNLNKRQAPGDSTCGFYNQTTPGVIYCIDGSQNVCATSGNGWGCCSATAIDSDCGFATTCVDSASISLYSTEFFTNPYVYACYESSAPLCATWYLEANGAQYTHLLCDTVSYDYTYYTTYSSDGIPGNYTASFYNGVYIPPSSTASTSTTSSSQPISTVPPSTSIPSSTTSTTTSASPTQTSQAPAPSHVGAIAGGTVGGVAVIVIAAIAAFCCLRQNKKKKQRNMEQGPVAGAGAYGVEHQQQYQQQHQQQPQQQQHWQGSPPIPMTHQQPYSTYDDNHLNPVSHQNPYAADSMQKQVSSPYTSQVTSPTMSGVSPGGALSHGSDGGYERQSMLSSGNTAVENSHSQRDGDVAELDGRIYRDYERY